MEGHGPFSITLANGKIFDAPRADTTFEIKGGLVVVVFPAQGRAKAQRHVLKDWEQLSAADEDFN